MLGNSGGDTSNSGCLSQPHKVKKDNVITSGKKSDKKIVEGQGTLGLWTEIHSPC